MTTRQRDGLGQGARGGGPQQGADGQGDLLAALGALRDQVARVRLPLAAPGVEEARRAQRELTGQLDDYVLPRLRSIEAPLLAVVGGSTGAGKSTLVNSLVGRPVSSASVLRPTTRGPVLVHAPPDERWFTDRRILPGLARATGGPHAPGGDARSLHLVAEPSLTPGLALLDAPDIDSVVTANRELAAQLLAAADLWVFVTTAARYADAVPWDLLRDASGRSAAVGVVLDRVPPEAVAEIRDHLAGMLRAQGLGDAPLFVVPETATEGGLLPPAAVEPVRRWLRELAGDARARAAVVRRTLDGVLDSFRLRVPALAAAVEGQERAAGRLRSAVVLAYDDAIHAVDEALRDGSLLRGEVLARWQEFIGTGELLRTLESRVGRLRDRVTAAVLGRPAPAHELEVALETGVESLIRAEADRAAERAATAWRGDAAGAVLLDGATERLDAASAALPERATRLVRDWQQGVLELVREQGQAKRSTARLLSYGVNGAALVVMIAVFAHTGGLTGGEVAVAGGASALSQKVLEALLGDQAVRDLAAAARADLRTRVESLLDGERARFLALLEATGVAAVDPGELIAAERVVERFR